MYITLVVALGLLEICLVPGVELLLLAPYEVTLHLVHTLELDGLELPPEFLQVGQVGLVFLAESVVVDVGLYECLLAVFSDGLLHLDQFLGGLRGVDLALQLLHDVLVDLVVQVSYVGLVHGQFVLLEVLVAGQVELLQQGLLQPEGEEVQHLLEAGLDVGGLVGVQTVQVLLDQVGEQLSVQTVSQHFLTPPHSHTL